MTQKNKANRLEAPDSSNKEAVWREEFLKTYSVICKIDLVRLRAILEIQEREPDVMGNNIVNSLTLYLAGRRKGQEVLGEATKSRDYSRSVCESQSKEIETLKKEIEELRKRPSLMQAENMDEYAKDVGIERDILRDLVERATVKLGSVKKYIDEIEKDDELFYRRWSFSVGELLKEASLIIGDNNG